ncbi:MAG: (2Fe-2S)-binding protein [Thermomicrobiales bacterium]|nr:MAG: (2Fe-2S)-binding protein [Thermomicrobiales bacterium]
MRAVSVAVIGAGPAGLSAAIAAAQAGAQVLLLDENPAVGGQLRYRVAPVAGPAGERVPAFHLARALQAEAESAGVELVSAARVWGVFPGRIVAVAQAERSWLVHAEQIVIATGSVDLPFPFPGGTLPGVYTARAVQILLHLHRVIPGARFAVIGAGALADEIAHDVKAAGGKVVVCLPPRAMAEDGAVEGATSVEVLRAGGQRFPVDTVVVAAGWQPDAQLALMAGCAATFDSTRVSWIPVRNELLQTDVPGITVAGEAGGAGDVEAALAEGRLAGLAAAASLGFPVTGALLTAQETLQRMQARGLPEVDRLPVVTRGIICRCEGVSAETVRRAFASGARTVNDIKRRTRAGMGPCQGVFCMLQIAGWLWHQDAGADLAPMTARPPARPISLAALAATEL